MLKKIGQYELVHELGAGGMGVVYRAVDTVLQREVALKRLRSEFAASPAVLERFRNEARLQGRLNHPNITQLYAVVQTQDAFCIVMEFVRGITMQDVLPLSWEQGVAVTLQVLAALECAHNNGVLHRDIKLENILIDATGTVKVMDFGIAYAIGTQRMTREKSLIGTMEYMAPERILGREMSAASDIYSLGILLFEMLAGQLPFGSLTEYDLLRWHVEQEAPLLSSVADVPKRVSRVVARCLRKDPAQRYESCGEMAEELRPLLDGTSPQAVLSPLVAPRIETAGVFDGRECFTRVWECCDRDEFSAAERILRNAANRHIAEAELRRYQRKFSRAVFVLEQEPSSRRAQALRRLLRISAAEKAGDGAGAERERSELGTELPGVDLVAVL